MQGELRPHKVRYYVERRDPECESKMAAVLHVYKEVEILNEGLLRGEICEPGMVTVSYDEKPGIQALAQKTPDRPAIPGSMPARPGTTNTNGWGPFGYWRGWICTVARSPRSS